MRSSTSTSPAYVKKATATSRTWPTSCSSTRRPAPLLKVTPTPSVPTSTTSVCPSVVPKLFATCWSTSTAWKASASTPSVTASPVRLLTTAPRKVARSTVALKLKWKLRFADSSGRLKENPACIAGRVFCCPHFWDSVRGGVINQAAQKKPVPKGTGFFFFITGSPGQATPVLLASDLYNLDLGLLRGFAELGDLVEAQVAIDIGSHGVDLFRVLHVLLDGRQLADDRSDRCQFGRSQVHVGRIAQTVREVTGRGGDHGRTGLYAGLVTHAQRAARHFHACTGLAVDAVVAFLGQLVGVHLGRRSQPQTGRNATLDLVQQLAGGAEVTDVGHARTDEDFVDLLAGNGGEQAGVVRVVRGAQNRFLDVGQIDFAHGGVLGVLVGFQQVRLGQPGFHRLGTTLQSARVAVAFADHPAQQGDVGAQVLGNRLFRQLDGAAGSGTFGGGVGQLESLLDGQAAQTFDLE